MQSKTIEMDKKNNERNAGRKHLPGKTRHLKITDEELAEVKKLLKEIRNNKINGRNIQNH